MSNPPAPRILQAMAGAPQGGAENFFVRLAGGLARAGVEQKIVIRRNPERAAALRAEGIEPVELPFGAWFDFTTSPTLLRLVRDWRPAVVLTWMNRATRAMPPGPFVHAARMGGYYDLKYYRRCHQLIGNTQDIVDHIVRGGWPPERAHYLPNFVDDRPADPVRRTDLGTADDAPVLLAAGRLHRNKAFDVLLAALARLPRATLWLAGEGPERDALTRQAADLGVAARVRFLGWRDDVAALCGAADIFVCPSRHEPLGNVVLEAWARGLPMVAASSQGPAGLIEDGRTGLLVPIDDAEALAAAIDRVLEDPALARDLARAGRAQHDAHFSEAAVVGRYIEFFQQVAA
ncbi:glycosyltransferase involved in cell wall biosynthesis [Stella humosa]|uniref:Glycosyltransferase involved in cell wall biosynthesis n=1 Tax=Stella humosa TaxID=94 RepID=A0A3N1M1W8_9PROT|nr:glycosyltransferase [Stella humosa]ROP99711.1 glycosyltransferase involved in cell wall biosynthesis [Stella humosa]BBK31062.1 glycosyl transferase [Stella humosa]